MKHITHVFLIFTLICQLITLPLTASALALGSGFQTPYLNLYKKYKTTHELADDAKKFRSANRNVAFLIEKLKSAPSEALPEARIQQGHVYFTTPEKTFKLSYIKNSVFLFDGKRIDLSKDLSKDPLFAQSESHWLIPSAEALFWMPVLVGAILIVMGTSLYCANENAQHAFEEAMRQSGLSNFKPKFQSAPSDFDNYLNQLVPKIRISCSGVAWGAEPTKSNYSFKGFFESYCADIKPGYRQTTSILAAQGLNESIAERHYGNADEAQKVVIQAMAQDHQFMKDCIEGSRHSRESSTAVEPSK